MPTTLTPQDINMLSMLPPASQFTGGMNAFSRAAFGNPQAPIGPYGIVPTQGPGPQSSTMPALAPGPTRIPQGPGPQSSTMPAVLKPLPNAQQQFLNLIRQKLGLPGSTTGGGQPANYLSTIRQTLGMQPRGAQAGGPGYGSTAAAEALSNIERSNVAVSPSLRNSIDLATSMGLGGLASQLGRLGLEQALGPGSLGILGSSLNTPGPQLSQAAMDAVTRSYMSALGPNPTPAAINRATAAALNTIGVERGLAGIGGHGQVNLTGSGVTPVGGWGTDPMGQLTGNFTSGLGNRFVGGANLGAVGGFGGGGGGGGFAGGGGPDSGGGLGGGVGGVGRSA